MIKKIKNLIIRYLIANHSPRKFVLTPPFSAKNNFYSLKFRLPPELTDLEITRKEPEHALYFTPIQQNPVDFTEVKGTLFDTNTNSPKSYSIDLNTLLEYPMRATYYYKDFRFEYEDVGNFKLTLLFLLKVLKIAALYRAVWILIDKTRKHRYHSKLNRHVLTRYDLLEAILLNNLVLKTGKFRESKLREFIFPKYPSTDFWINNRIKLQLKWALEACIAEGEIKQISLKNDLDPVYELLGKGVNYYHTMRNEQRLLLGNQKIQRTQTKLQFWLVIATILLALTSLNEVLSTEQKNSLSDFASYLFCTFYNAI